jgi:predicted amidohydrolase
MVLIAGVQFVGNADKEINIRTAIRMVREAVDRGTRIICLPELFSTMYFCVETRREYFDWAEPIPGPPIDRMRDVARETGTVLIAPIFERAPDGRFFNSATVIGPDGQLIGKYGSRAFRSWTRPRAPSRRATRSSTSRPATSAFLP